MMPSQYRIAFSCLTLAFAAATTLADETPRNTAEQAFNALRDAYLVKYKPLRHESELAWWQASTTGADEAFQRRQRAENALVELHGDPRTFAKLKSLREGGQITDPLLARELDVLYRTFHLAQADKSLQKQIIAIQNDVEQIFNTHRSPVGGKTATENEVRTILRSAHDSQRAKEAWTGYVGVGRKVADKLRQAVKLRNQLARGLGFPNYYSMRLDFQEIDQDSFFKLFDELDRLTRQPFAKLKTQIDARMAKRFSIATADLKPWHYGDIFFQEAPMTDDVDLDALFADADLIALVTKYYASIGMPCDDVVARSDLYEKEGKSPHAFCTDIDREGDIRVLCNLKPTLMWADTLQHELGHAVYDKYIRRDVPFLLRKASHAITTEGAANMFGALVKNEHWLTNVRGLPPEDAAKVGVAVRKMLRTEKIIFSRWTQVMVRFEHGMYTNPDQDLAQLWWNLKKEYQLLNPPDDITLPGYGAKVHVLTDPVYYHSYLMGDLFATQVHAYVARKVLGIANPSDTSFYNQPKAGEYFRNEIFGPGDSYSWNELVKRATGEPLTPRYFVEQFIDENEIPVP